MRPGSALDRDALTRGNSVYFPDRVVPMLPERISNDLCSLKPGENARRAGRAHGDRRRRPQERHSFHRVLMRSAAKLSYEQAQAAIDGRPDDTTGPLLEPILKPLCDAYARWSSARATSATRSTSTCPSARSCSKPDGTVDRVIVPAAARCAPPDRRVHDPGQRRRRRDAGKDSRAADLPRARRAELGEGQTLREFLTTLDLPFAKCGALRPRFQPRARRRQRTPNSEPLVNEVVLRSQAQAEYAAENFGHFGLNLRRYAHFTSPIRRYADLIVHRALIRGARRLAKARCPRRNWRG